MWHCNVNLHQNGSMVRGDVPEGHWRVQEQQVQKLATLLRAHGGTHDNSQTPDREDLKDGSFDEVLEVGNLPSD